MPFSSISTIVDSDFDILRHARLPVAPVTNGFNGLLQALGNATLASMLRYHKRHMFRISTVDTRSQRTLVVEGMLVGPWVAELRTSWRNACQELGGRKLTIDLRDLTTMSRAGEDAIFDLMKEGAKFSCGNVLTKHVLQQLARKKRQELPGC